MIRRLLAVPLSPLTPHGGWSPFGRSRNPAEEEVKALGSSNNPPHVSLNIPSGDLEAQPAYDKYGQLTGGFTEKARANPQPQTRAGMSFFSWSSPSVTPPVAAARRATQSSSARLSRRNTNIPRDESRDSEPARFRTVKSWVAHQQQRHTRQSYRRMSEDKANVEEVPAISQEHTRKTSNPNEQDAAAFKFGFPRSNGTESPETPASTGTEESASSPMSANSPVKQVAMSASRAQNPHIVNIPSRELSQRGRFGHHNDSSPPQTQQSNEQPSKSNINNTASSNYDALEPAVRASIPPPPPAPAPVADPFADPTPANRPTSHSDTATTSRTTLTIFRTHPGEKWEYRGPKLGKGDRRIDSGVLDRLRKAGWASITRDSR